MNNKYSIDNRDHDLLIAISTDVKYIKKNIQSNKDSIIWLKGENQERKDWQENWGTKTKVCLGIASFIGGIIVFITDKVWGLFLGFKK